MNHLVLKTTPAPWVSKTPMRAVLFLLGVYWVGSQWNPCDSTSVSLGNSLILIVLGIGLGLLSALHNATQVEYGYRTKWCILAAVFYGWLMVATWGAIGHSNARAAFLGFWQTVALLGVLQALCLVFQFGEYRSSAWRWLFGLCAGVSGYALHQYLVSMPATREAFRLDRTRLLEQIGLVEGTPEAMQFENRLFSSEPTGTFSLTNSLAGYLAPAVVILFFALLLMLIAKSMSRGKSEPKKQIITGNLIFGTTLFLVLAAVVFLTKSRTAWVATAIGLGLSVIAVIVHTPRGYRRLLLLGVLSCSLLGMLALGLVLWKDPLVVSEAGKSLMYRMEYWKGAWQLALQSPLVGYGPLSFQSHYASVKAITASENPADPHNLWMELLVCGGFPLLLAALGTAVVWAIEWFRNTDCKSSSSDPVAGSTNQSLTQPSWTLIDVGAFTANVAILLLGLVFFSVNSDLDALDGVVIFVAASLAVVYGLKYFRFDQVFDQRRNVVCALIVLVVSIHLFFSGGWMQPGSMNPLLIGLSGALSRSDSRQSEIAQGPKPSMAWGVVLIWICVALVFGWTTLYPEMSRSALESAYKQSESGELSPEDAQRDLSKNTWDPEIAEWIARASFSRSLDTRLGEGTRKQWLDVFSQAESEWVKRDSSNWTVHSQLGVMNGTLADALSSSSKYRETFDTLQRRCRDRFERAVELYPVSVQNRLQISVVSLWMQDRSQAQEHLREAKRIDEATPHLDRKISAISVWFPPSLEGTPPDFDLEDRMSRMPGFLKGEPVFSWLRKQVP